MNNGYDSIVLSSFFWGYTLMQVPSGYLAKTRSAKLVLGIGLFISGFASLIVPLANDVGDWLAICACRVIMGLSQACLLPCTHTLLSKWVPPSERGRLGNLKIIIFSDNMKINLILSFNLYYNMYIYFFFR